MPRHYQHLEALDPQWLEAQPKEKQAALLLRAYRERNKCSLEAFAAATHISEGTLQHWETSLTPIATDKLGTLCRELLLNPSEAEDFILRCDKGIIEHTGPAWLKEQIAQKKWDIIDFPALDPQWVQAQPANEQPGLLLRVYRERKKYSRDALAAATGISEGMLQEWENLKKLIAKDKLGTLCRELSLNSSEAEDFILRRDKGIIEHTGPAWLRNRIASKQWGAVDLPALDSQWLKAQPEDKRPGLLLKAYRKRLGLSQPEFADAIGELNGAVSTWESGEHPVPEYKAGTLANALKLSQTEAERFILLVHPDIAEHTGVDWLRKNIAGGQWSTLDAPALNREWLDAQPAGKQGGLLLRAYRERRKYSLDALATATRIPEGTLQHWETFRSQIATNKLGTLCHELSLSSSEAEDFILRRDKSIIEHTGPAWLKGKITLKEWGTIDLPAFDSRWLAAQPEDKRAGALLKAYRERSGLSQPDLATLIGVSPNVVSAWETTLHPVPEYHAGSLANALRLSEAEAEKFILLVHPDITEHTGIDWLRKNIARGQWTTLDAPALNREWLAAQPAEKQGGLLLQGLRNRKGLTQDDLGAKLGVSGRMIGLWEAGEPFYGKAGTLAKTLDLSPQEALQLLPMLKPKFKTPEGAQWLENALSKPSWKAIDFPALDPDFLATRPAESRAGELLNAYMERADISALRLSKITGINRKLLSSSELLPTKHLETVAKSLQLSAQEKDTLEEAMATSRAARSVKKPEVKLGAVTRSMRVHPIEPEEHPRNR